MNNAALPYWRLSGFYFFYFAVVGALVPYWGLYVKSLGYSSQDVGVIGAIILATRIVAPNFWGWLADKSQRPLPIIRLGSLLAACMFAGVLVDQRYSWLVLVVSLYTFFWHAVLPQFEVITLGYLGENHQAYSRIRLWGSVGFSVAVVGLGWAFNWLAIGYLPLFILTFLLLILLSSLSLQEQPRTAKAAPGAGFFALLQQPVVIAFLVASFLLQLGHGPYYTFYSLYLVENYGYSSAATGLLWALGVVAEVVMFMAMPLLLRRYSLRQLLLASLLITAARWLMIGYGAASLAVLLFAQLLHAWSFAVAHAVSIDIVRRLFNQHKSQGQSLYSSASFGAGGALGALMGGLLWDNHASLTFLVGAVAAIAAFVICWRWLHMPEASHRDVG